MDYPYSDSELQVIEENRGRRAVGTAEQVTVKMRQLADQFKLDEIMLVTITHDPAARRRSYELIAAAWD